MNDLQCAGLLDRTVRGCTVWAIDGLPSKSVDGLDEGLPLYVLETGASETLQI